jgi:hypothetical protein
VDLEDSVALRFINATTEDALVQFFARFGLATKIDELRVEIETEQQAILSVHLQKALSGDAAHAGPAVAHLLKSIRLQPAFDFSGSEQTARLTLRADTLRQFMIMEIAFAAAAGARLSRCEYCGTAFLMGPMTGRRSTAKFCSDRCRVAAMRQRNATTRG